MAIILLNGPMGCGKGEAYKFIRAIYNAKDGRVKKRLHEIASAIFQVPHELWEEREGKEKPNPKLRICCRNSRTLSAHMGLVSAKLWHPEGLYELSPRQALIYVSEVLCKPMFGDDYFGRERLKLIAEPGLYVDDSAGFPAELGGLDPARTLIIQVIGRGKFGPNDSRGYVSLPGAHVVTINNAWTLSNFLKAVERTVDEWLGTWASPGNYLGGGDSDVYLAETFHSIEKKA